MSLPNITSGNIEYIDGFDDYNTSQMSRYITSAGACTISANGRRGSGAISLPNGGSFTIGLTNQATRVIGFAFIAGSIPSSATILLTLTDNGSVQVDLRINANGTISITRNGTLLSTSSFSINAGIWYYIEFQVTIDPSVGSYNLKVNGNSWTSGSGVNTRVTSNSYFNLYKFTYIAATTSYVDDLYIRSDSTFMGDQTVLTDFPNANGATDQWTPLTSSNYVEVQDNPSDDDTSYNSTGSASQIDLFAFPTLSISSGTVGAVLISAVLKTDASGVATACIEYRQSTTNTAGGTQYIGSSSYNSYEDISINDPTSGSAWTISTVNSAQFGYQRLT